jgi:hypothetical protein
LTVTGPLSLFNCIGNDFALVTPFEGEIDRICMSTGILKPEDLDVKWAGTRGPFREALSRILPPENEKRPTVLIFSYTDPSQFQLEFHRCFHPVKLACAKRG